MSWQGEQLRQVADSEVANGSKSSVQPGKKKNEAINRHFHQINKHLMSIVHCPLSKNNPFSITLHLQP